MSEVKQWAAGAILFLPAPWETGRSPEYCVQVGSYVEVPGRPPVQLGPPRDLTPAQAQEAGYSLADLVPGINAAAILDRDVALVTMAALRSERDALAARVAELEVAAPAAPTAVVSDRQFFQALALAGAIGPDEALAAVMTGVLPGRIEAAVAALPEAEQFSARMLLSGATTFERGHPMVAQLGSGLGYDAAALDALWAAAAAL